MSCLVSHICDPYRQQIQWCYNKHCYPHSPAEGPDDNCAVLFNLEGDYAQEVIDVNRKGEVDHPGPVLVDYEGAYGELR